MQPDEKDALIISLIKDDIINSQLVNGLIAIGLDASPYHLHAGDTAFRLMGFKEDNYGESVFEFYRQFIKRSKPINLSISPELVDEMVLEIYKLLLVRVPAL